MSFCQAACSERFSYMVPISYCGSWRKLGLDFMWRIGEVLDLLRGQCVWSINNRKAHLSLFARVFYPESFRPAVCVTYMQLHCSLDSIPPKSKSKRFTVNHISSINYLVNWYTLAQGCRQNTLFSRQNLTQAQISAIMSQLRVVLNKGQVSPFLHAMLFQCGNTKTIK